MRISVRELQGLQSGAVDTEGIIRELAYDPGMPDDIDACSGSEVPACVETRFCPADGLCHATSRAKRKSGKLLSGQRHCDSRRDQANNCSKRGSFHKLFTSTTVSACSRTGLVLGSTPALMTVMQ